MSALAVATASDRVFVGRRILALLNDPRSNAARLGRLLDAVGPLADAVIETAEVLYEGRGRVTTTAQAVTLIGFNRLERLTRRFLRQEYARLADEAPEVSAPAPQPHALALVPRYAAM